MTIRTTALAAMLAMTLTATATANAQEVSSGGMPATPEEIAQLVNRLLAQLQPFADENGLTGFNEELRAVFEARLPASLVVIPQEKADDLEFKWASGLHLDTGYDVPEDGVLAANPERELYGDALECSRSNGDRSVAYFRRISENGMVGHVCTLGYVEGDKAVLLTRSVFEGGQRRGWTNFEGMARVEGDPVAATALLEPAIAGNVALAEAFDAVMMRNLPLARPNRAAGPAAATP
jgi:hypothetical protein